MQTDTSTIQPNDESSLIETRKVTDVLILPCTTSALNDTSSFEPMQLGMEFDGEEASAVTDADISHNTMVWSAYICCKL